MTAGGTRVMALMAAETPAVPLSAPACAAPGDAPQALEALIAQGRDRLPLPAGGATLLRWRALADVGQQDLSLAKLFEGHTDALAILAELGAEAPPPGQRWATWAAETPQGRALLRRDAEDGSLRLDGAKHWCSGAEGATHALLTAWIAGDAAPQLVQVAMDQPGIAVRRGAWQSVGMAGSPGVEVHFSGARAEAVGPLGAYLSRPGFWHGGAGVAACWWGGARALAAHLRAALAARPTPLSPHALAALGKVDVALQSAAAVLREAAAWIDRHPRDDAQAVALRTRLAVEACADTVLSEAGRALGATPFCTDARFARMAADLPVFLRQSHAERDLASLGQVLLSSGQDPWAL